MNRPTTLAIAFVVVLVLCNITTSAQPCADLSGEWTVTEVVEITTTIAGESSTDTQSGTDKVVITQSGCTARYTKQLPLPTGGIYHAERVGQVVGNTVTFTGVAAVPLPGLNCSKNELKSTGTLVGNQINADTTFEARCTTAGINVLVTGNGTATFARTVPLTANLRGTVRLGTATGTPLPGVTIRLTSASSVPRDTLTDANGRYAFGGLTPGSYTVTPGLPGHVFDPRETSVTLNQDTDVPVFVAWPVPTLAVTRMWSDQWDSNEFNGLPLDPNHNRGAGELGNSLGLVFLGARMDGTARVKAQIEVQPSNSPLAGRVRVALVTVATQNPPVTLTTATPQNGIAGLALPFTGTEVEAKVVAWVDLDQDGRVSVNPVETTVEGPGHFLIIGQTGYQDAIQELRGPFYEQWGAGLLLPIAYRLLDSFLAHKSPEHSQPVASQNIHPDRDLSHNVGIRHDSNGTAALRRFAFSGTTDVAVRIRRSMAIKTRVAAALARHRQEIRNAFDAGQSSFEIPLYPTRDPNQIEFPASPEGALAWPLDEDLYFSFHVATVIDAKCVVHRDKLDHIAISGLLTDTYDFKGRLPGGLPSQLATKVQAGFDTLGDGGEVFGLQVTLDGDVSNVRWDGAPSLRADSVLVLRDLDPGGVRIRIEVVHAPDRVVVIERTSDFFGWEPVAESAPGTTGTVLLIDSSADLPWTFRFYRARIRE
ncbi:MAG: carboxypeptidase regulatory-like domain-containing protein [Limisphaerales bacterium]